MTYYSLRLANDPVVHYWMHADDAAVGQVRVEDVHAFSLHLGDRRYWLVHEGSARGDSLLARLLARFRLDRTWLLKDGDTELARARRHWTLFGRRDWIEYTAADETDPVDVESKGMMSREIHVFRNGVGIGHMGITGTLRDGASLQCPGFSPAQAALLMLVVHDAWGNKPHVSLLNEP
jgi:hypothetical protein